MKLQTALEKLIQEYDGMIYRKAWLDKMVWNAAFIKLGNQGIFYIYDSYSSYKPFVPDVADIIAEDWIYELLGG